MKVKDAGVKLILNQIIQVVKPKIGKFFRFGDLAQFFLTFMY